MVKLEITLVLQPAELSLRRCWLVWQLLVPAQLLQLAGAGSVVAAGRRRCRSGGFRSRRCCWFRFRQLDVPYHQLLEVVLPELCFLAELNVPRKLEAAGIDR